MTNVLCIESRIELKLQRKTSLLIAMNLDPTALHYKKLLRGDVKKVVVLGDAHHKMPNQHPPPVVAKLPLFVWGIFFGLESPDSRK